MKFLKYLHYPCSGYDYYMYCLIWRILGTSNFISNKTTSIHIPTLFLYKSFPITLFMGINIKLYITAIGRIYNNFGTKSLLANLFFWYIIYPTFVVLNWVVPNILHHCNDIESNQPLSHFRFYGPT